MTKETPGIIKTNQSLIPQKAIEHEQVNQKIQNLLRQHHSSAEVSGAHKFQGLSMKNHVPETRDSQGYRDQLQSIILSTQYVPGRNADSNLDYYFGQTTSRSPTEGVGAQSQSAPVLQYSQNAVYASKSYRFLCHICNRPFTKLLVVDMTIYSDREISICDIQNLFSTRQNQTCDCPFCRESCYLLLSTSMILGSQEQLDQLEILQTEMLHHQQDTENDDKGQSKQIQGQFRKSDRSLSEEKQQNNDNLSQQSARLSTFKITPRILQHKLQKLKDGEKYAQLFIMTDIPEKIKQSAYHMTRTTQVDSEDPASQNQFPIYSESGLKYQPFELSHKPVPNQCAQFNKDLMRNLINKKMRRNKSFLELKIFPNTVNRCGAQPVEYPQKLYTHFQKDSPLIR